MTLPVGVWAGTGTPLAAPYPCRCPEDGRASCGRSGWPPPNGAEGGCPCWGRPDAWRFIGCCGRWWAPAPSRVALALDAQVLSD
jgi:hypothetical protein